jgi:hypothetical protein
VVELRLDEAEKARFKGMLRTVNRRSGNHAAVPPKPATEKTQPAAEKTPGHHNRAGGCFFDLRK